MYLREDYIATDPFDRRLVPVVAAGVAQLRLLLIALWPKALKTL